MYNPSFLTRFLVFFIPLLLFFFLMYAAGITNNMFLTIILSLAVVWMVQAGYKHYMKKSLKQFETKR